MLSRYSRRVIWLEVGTSNNSAAVIAFYYIEAVKLLKDKNTCNLQLVCIL